MSEADTGSAAGRKRRWGSSTSVIAKKPSISITTDSLKVLTRLRDWTQVSTPMGQSEANLKSKKNLLISVLPPTVAVALQSLIPDIKLNQEAVVELHPEELQLSGDEESQDAGRDDQDKGLKIRRTVTQVWTDSLLRIEAGEIRDSSCRDLSPPPLVSIVFVRLSQARATKMDKQKKRKRWRRLRKTTNTARPETRARTVFVRRHQNHRRPSSMKGRRRKVHDLNEILRVVVVFRNHAHDGHLPSRTPPPQLPRAIALCVAPLVSRSPACLSPSTIPSAPPGSLRRLVANPPISST